MSLGDEHSRVGLRRLIWPLAVVLSLLPTLTTFNEFMTAIALRTGTFIVFRQIAPMVSKMVATILRYVFGVETSVSGASVFLHAGGIPYEVFLDWNCIGWQSFILLSLILVTCLQGCCTARSKLKSVVLGVEFAILANMARIIVPCLLLVCWGYRPAVIFHNHLSTPFILVWLGAFWYLCNDFILERGTSEERKPLWVKVVEPIRDLRFRSLLPDFIMGRRTMGLVMMAIILILTGLNGVVVLSGKIPVVDCDYTALSFEYSKEPVVIGTIRTNRYLTLPDWTKLGETHTDEWKNPGVPGWYKVWEFYLYGPLEKEYKLEGNIVYYVYLYCSKAHVTPMMFHIYDVDPSGLTAPILVHSDEFKVRLRSSSPPRPIVLKGEKIKPYKFPSGHTISIRIDVYDDGKAERVYLFDYDSKEKHSYADFPGIVVPEKMLPSSILAFLILAFRQRPRRRNDG